MPKKCAECERLKALLGSLHETHEAYEVGSALMVDAIDEFLQGELSLEATKVEARRLRHWIGNAA